MCSLVQQLLIKRQFMCRIRSELASFLVVIDYSSRCGGKKGVFNRFFFWHVHRNVHSSSSILVILFRAFSYTMFFESKFRHRRASILLWNYRQRWRRPLVLMRMAMLWLVMQSRVRSGMRWAHHKIHQYGPNSAQHSIKGWDSRRFDVMSMYEALNY